VCEVELKISVLCIVHGRGVSSGKAKRVPCSISILLFEVWRSRDMQSLCLNMQNALKTYGDEKYSSMLS
jgi:hypothetical protein